jgi:hypothetical protein
MYVSQKICYTNIATANKQASLIGRSDHGLHVAHMPLKQDAKAQATTIPCPTDAQWTLVSEDGKPIVYAVWLDTDAGKVYAQSETSTEPLVYTLTVSYDHLTHTLLFIIFFIIDQW